MNSVFIFARTYLGIDTGWNFATGAPAGLIKDPWNIRLLPHYWLAVFFVLSHIAAGTRNVMMAHGASKAFADRFVIGGVVTAAIIATAIMLGMCGLRLRFRHSETSPFAVGRAADITTSHTLTASHMSAFGGKADMLFCSANVCF